MKSGSVEEVIIIGAGPTGLTAAWIMTFSGVRYRIFGDTNESAANLATEPYDFPLGIRETDGENILETLKDALQAITNPISNKLIVDIYKEYPDIFTVVDSDGKKYHSRRIVFATGIPRNYVSIDKMDDYLDKGFNYHHFKFLFKSRSNIVGLVGTGIELVRLAPYFVSFSKRLNLFVIDEVINGDEKAVEFIRRNPNITVFEHAEPLEVIGNSERLTGLRIKISHDQDYIVALDHLITVPILSRPLPHLTNIGVEFDGPFIKIDQNFRTNVENFYAGGDIVGGRMSIMQALSHGHGLGYIVTEDVFYQGEKSWMVYLTDKELDRPREARYLASKARKTPLVEEVENWKELYKYYEHYAPVQGKFERLAQEFPFVSMKVVFNPISPMTRKIIPQLAKVTAFLPWEIEVMITGTYGLDEFLGEQKAPVLVELSIDGVLKGTIQDGLRFGRIEDELFYVLKGMDSDVEIWEEFSRTKYDREYEEKYS